MQHLTVYVSDSDEEKSDDDDPQPHSGSKRKEVEAESTQVVADGADQKRQRFDFLLGWWPTHVRLEVQSAELASIRDKVCAHLAGVEGTHWTAVEDAHVSLSTTTPTREVEHADLSKHIADALADVEPFTLTLGWQLALYPSETRGRTFVGLRAAQGSAQVKQMVMAVNRVMSQWGHDTYYDGKEDELDVHVSLSVADGDLTSHKPLNDVVNAYNATAQQLCQSGDTSEDTVPIWVDVFVESAVLSFANRVSVISLG